MMFSRLPSLVLFLLLAIFAGNCKEDKRKSPNVVFILMDDQGYGDLGIHGNKWVETPTINELARAGARLDRFFVCPLCAPTRATILTGRYHIRSGVTGVSNGLENMSAEEFTLAEMFKSAGYATGCFGKWHNGAYWPYHPNAQGFDEFVGFCAGHWNNYFDTELQHNGQPYPTKGYITDVLTDEAISFIEKNKEEPFFCYIPFNVPHSPFQVPDQYYNKYYEKLEYLHDEAAREKDAAVYGMVENADDNIRRILQKLSDLNIRENTIVIYLSDNGPNGERYNERMRGIKGSTHEGGVRVPCFISWPGQIPEGKIFYEIAGHIDMLPTLASLCQIKLPEQNKVDGINLASALLGNESLPGNRTLYFQQSYGDLSPDRGGVRNNAFRYTLENKSEGVFDMHNDPSETRNLFLERAGLFDSLKRDYLSWYNQITEQYIANTDIPVGYPKFPVVTMPAHESYFSGNITFKEGHGWANDWLTNWTSPQDSIWWNIDVVKSGSYQVSLEYTCAEQQTGSEVRVSASGDAISGRVTQAFDPDYLPSPDRVPRKEAYEKKWAKLDLGTINLKEGKQQLVVTANPLQGNQVMELKSVIVISAQQENLQSGL